MFGGRNVTLTTEHVTSDRVYSALKSEILTGDVPAGRLPISRLLNRYVASATPVREALLRLVGERLVIMPSGGGFAVPALDRRDIEDMYETSLRLTLVAAGYPATRSAQQPDPWGVGDRALDPPIDQLFALLARRMNNRSFSAVFESLQDRMCRVRHAEQRTLNGLTREFRRLEELVRYGPDEKLKRALHSYHRRRIGQTHDIQRAILEEDAAKYHSTVKERVNGGI